MKQSQLIYFITEWAVKVDGEGKVDEAGARRPEGSESSEGGGIALSGDKYEVSVTCFPLVSPRVHDVVR